MEKFSNSRYLISNWPGLDADVRAALLGAVSSRGKWQGYMLNNAPPASRSAHRAAWYAMLAEVAPARFPVGAVLLMPEQARELFDRCSWALAGSLGTCLQAQEPAYRWSLFAHHNDCEAIQAAAAEHCHKRALELAGQQTLDV
jgi:hypothetical protein